MNNMWGHQAALRQAGDSGETKFGFLRTRRTAGASSVEMHQTVLKYVQATIEYDRPTICEAAEAASMPVRTLQRELASSGVTFVALLDKYRLRQADIYLRCGDLSITDIAFKLGYSDSAHFTRAFRRWTGRNPREYRQTLSQNRGRQHLC